MPMRELVLMDIDPRKLRIVGGLAKRMVEHAALPCPVSLTESYDDALRDADFVFVQIRVGKLPARVLDEKIPLRYGLIGQETTGIGGFFKALRTIPVLMDLVKRMERLCPNAWMVNFTNPSGICAQALLDHTNVKMLGLCNAPINIIRDAREACGTPDMAYLGLNHLSFVTGVTTPAEEVLGFSPDLIRTIGAVPSYYLQYFIHPRKKLAELQAAPKSRGEECMEIEEELLKLYEDVGLYEKPKLLEKRGGAMYSEAACSLAEAIHTDNNTRHVVNAYNAGAIDFMNPTDVVEAYATVNKNGATMLPVTAPVSDYIRSIMQAVKAYERLTVQAALTGNRDTALAALMANPLIADYDTATAAFNEMATAHKEWLPQFRKTLGD
jgi:6-phospho-beta-glucosidase